jgi:uncharacterized protein YceH (UPF0502 family)
MPSFELNPVETRVLGCLLEKERTVPESYPLTLNSLITACNQTTSREPVTAYDERTVEAALFGLREKKVATAVFGSGSRVQKYRHNLLDHFELDLRDVAVLCVLMLRGPQTPGELRGRAERMFHFNAIEEIEGCVEGLGRGDFPLVKLLPQQPGQKERRYVQLLSAEPEGGWPAVAQEAASPRPAREAPGLKTLEEEVAALRQEVAELKGRVAALEAGAATGISRPACEPGSGSP